MQFPHTNAFLLTFGVAIWLLTATAHADYQAKVIHVADGDTITVLNDAKEEIKIRLNGIDSPETGQAFGHKAKDFTKDLVAGKMVTIQAHDQDKYGRTIADVILKDGRKLSQELVKAGYAWWFFKYSNDEALGTLEVKAKLEKVGLWADKDPVPPWIFRHRDQNISVQPTVPDTPSVGLLAPPSPSNDLPTLGNKRSQKFHRPDCPSYQLISPKNRVPFTSPKAAEAAGFTLAGNCQNLSK